MKKAIIGGLLALVLVSPNPVKAQTVTNEQLLAQINSLMQIVMSLMEQLKNVETKQNTIVQNTTPVVQAKVVSEPVLGAATQPTLTPVQILTKQIEDKFASKAATCTRSSWTDTFTQLKPWFDVNREEATNTGFYEAYDRVNGYITFAYESTLQDKPAPSTNFLCGDRMGCKKVLETQMPYISCMLSQ